MAAPSGRYYPVGLQQVRVYELDAHGMPKASAASGVVYEGFVFEGAEAFDLSVPDVRRITHIGDNAIKATDMLPRIEPSTGTLTVAGQYADIIALLSSTKVATVGEAKAIGFGTSQQGQDPVVGLLMYQQAKEASTGTRVWIANMVPSTQMIVSPISMNQEKQSTKFSLLPSAVGHHLWGTAFTANREGFTTAESISTITVNVPHVCSWLADNSVTEFLFHASRQAVSTAKIHEVVTVATNGTVTDVTSTCTKATDGVTIAGPLAAGVMVVCFYEYAAG